ncbi:unnamed protein product [Penicillium egyptiacum]|uniref:Nephrocystin 3-like N-terminal domain-containing protein n=1 Tax=Penicillium egyptiacum TaxID=1303716 RepID=A0A9W4KHD6_9EURO|nr:unnamed protein product [Penicillium egyptiacum]
MSSSPSDGNDPILVGLDDVPDFNVDRILPLRATDIVEIKKWLQPTAYDLERSALDIALHILQEQENGSPLQQPIDSGIRATKMACYANHQPMAALRSWLSQLLDYSPTLQVKLKNYIDEERGFDTLAHSDIWKDFKLVLAALPKVYCITDALDEMDQGNGEFMHALVELG